MNILFVHSVRQRFLAMFIIFLAVFALLIAILPVMALQTPTTIVISKPQAESCYTQLASEPTLTFTSTNAAALQTAINAAPPGDIVKIAGTCRGVSFTHELTQTAYINKDLVLQGGFTGGRSQQGIYRFVGDALRSQVRCGHLTDLLSWVMGTYALSYRPATKAAQGR